MAKRRIAARTSPGRGVWHLWVPIWDDVRGWRWSAVCGTKHTDARHEDDLREIFGLWRSAPQLWPSCARCRGIEPTFASRARARRRAELEDAQRREDPHRRAAESVVAACCERLRLMPDFAGRTADDPHGGMEGILRSEAIDVLSALPLDDLAALVRRAMEDTA